MVTGQEQCFLEICNRYFEIESIHANNNKMQQKVTIKKKKKIKNRITNVLAE